VCKIVVRKYRSLKTSLQHFVAFISASFHQELSTDVGVEVLTPVFMSSSILCDITPCSPLKVNRYFKWTCRAHLQGRRINQERNQHEAISNMYLSFDSEDGSYMLLRNFSWLYKGLHDVIGSRDSSVGIVTDRTVRVLIPPVRVFSSPQR
jgi:hypothetical protein